jgi:hypothetical protein
LFKLKDGNILLDDKPEQTQSDALSISQTAEPAVETTSDEDLEFPAVLPDGDVSDVPWVM